MKRKIYNFDSSKYFINWTNRMYLSMSVLFFVAFCVSLQYRNVIFSAICFLFFVVFSCIYYLMIKMMISSWFIHIFLCFFALISIIFRFNDLFKIGNALLFCYSSSGLIFLMPKVRAKFR